MTANTSIVYHARRILALHEQDLPYAMRVLCSGVVATLHRETFGAKLHHPFTAHPKVDPVTGEMYFFGMHTAPPQCHISKADAKGKIVSSFAFPLPQAPMMHDMAITENHLLLLDVNLTIAPQVMMKSDHMPFLYDLSRPARIGVIPRDASDASELRWFDIPATMIFHTANAWEEGDCIKFYACGVDEELLKIIIDEHLQVKLPDRQTEVKHPPKLNLAAMFPFTRTAPHKGAGVRTGDHIAVDLTTAAPPLTQAQDEPTRGLFEWTLNMKTGAATQRCIYNGVVDFPVIHPNLLGRTTRYVYLAHFCLNPLNAQRILKIDLMATDPQAHVVGTVEYPPGVNGGEALFVPRQCDSAELDGEDDGYLLVYLHDELEIKSHFAVYDAKTMSPEPLAIAHLPQRVPYGFHGQYFTDAQLKQHAAQFVTARSDAHNT
jgi:carotenoid cleavage dioxygenase